MGLYIDQFDAGYLRAASLAWEEMMERDDTLSIVAPKRRKQVSRRRWEVLIGEEVPENRQAEAELQQAELKRFYANVQARNSVDRNQTGGIRMLINRVMDAPLMRYSAHEIEWKPSPSGLTATFHYVPLAFLDNTTGTLRFAGAEGTTPGAEMDLRNWLIGASETCLMKAASVCYMFKRLSLQDWLNLSEKFGIPGIHGQTDAQKGSAEWDEFMDALTNFANDWMIGTGKGTDIKLIEAGSKGNSPFEPMVDRMDRAMARLMLGSDLATLSRENGTGASLQGDDAMELIADDCAWISELFQTQLDRKVLDWAFGEGTEQLAFFTLAPPQKMDAKLEMEIDKHCRDMGAPPSPEDVAERCNRTYEKPDAAALAANERPWRMPPLRSTPPTGRNAYFDALRSGVQQDLVPLRDALLVLESGLTPDEQRAHILSLAGGLPAIEAEVLEGDAANDAFEALMAAEFLGGLASLGPPLENESANVFNPFQLRDLFGKWLGFGSGGGKGPSREGKTKPGTDAFGMLPVPGISYADNLDRGNRAMAWVMRNKKDVKNAVHHPSLGAVEFPWGTPGNANLNFAGGFGVSHIVAKHGAEDAKALPKHLLNGIVNTDPDDANKRLVRSGNYLAVLVKDKETSAWVLTGFTNKNK